MNRLWLGALAATLVSACGTPQATPAACGPSNCAGCCGSGGQCVNGYEPAQCGSAGLQCVDCTSVGRCGATRTCEPAQGLGVGDLCSSPIDLTIANGVAAATGDSSSARDDTSGSCGGGGGGDLVYRFTTPNAGTLAVDLRPKSGSTFRPVVYLRSSCDTGSTEIAGGCVAGASASSTALLVVPNLAAGTYFLWVDGADASSGAFDLSLSLTADGADRCTNPVPLTFGDGTATVMATTQGMADDGSGTCGGAGGTDAIFSFDVTAISHLEATVTPKSASLRPVVYLRSATCTGAERGCAIAGGAGASAFMRLGSLPVGTYFLWVDSGTASAGAFELAVRLIPPVIGDSCATAKPLTFSNGPAGGTASDSADLSSLFNEATGTCIAGTSPDLVYTFTTDRALNLRASASTTGGTFRPALYLRSATCTGAERGCAVAPAAGGTADLSVGSLAAGTYFLWVDGAAGTVGPFTLSANLSDPLPGDGCTNPKALAFSGGAAGGTASDTGDTATLFHDATGACAAGTSADAVYSFTTNAPLNLRVDVSTTTSTYRPVVYLRNATCTGVERACGAATLAGGTASIAVASLPAGTYYLWVDGAAGSSGAYSLSATLVPPPPGDTCAIAKPLVFSSGAAGGTASDSADTAVAFNDLGGACNATSGSTGLDLVYTFTTNTILDLAANAAATSGGFQPVLYLRSATCTGAELGCAVAPAAGGTASLSVNGLNPGTYYLWVDGASGSSGAFTLSASLLPPPPAEVRPRAFTDVMVPGPMGVTYEVVDRYGTVVTSDSSTMFTLTVTGSAVFSGAVTGTINSGAGTNSILVTVANGVISVNATDAVAEAVTFAAIDSQANGLLYTASSVSQTLPVQALACGGGTNSFSFNMSQAPTGNGTLTIYARGDFDLSTELITVFMESAVGTSYGDVFVVGGLQCSANYLSATVNVPVASLTSYLADGVVGVALRTSISVNCICAPQDVYVRLAFPIASTARFL